MKIKDLGEIKLIKKISKGLRIDNTVVKGVGDDTAVIKLSKNKYLLFTSDMSVEGSHFTLKTATPFQIGWKALGRNISDIAAMGGIPKYAVVSAGISDNLPVSFAEGVYKGIKTLADKFGVNIVGGDTVRTKKLTIDIALIGEVEKKNLVLRSTARTGDLIFVTGEIGGSIKLKHLNFMPRIKEARQLVRDFKVNSMIDISDGLLLDLWRIARASCKGFRIYKSAVPVSKDAASFESAITDGEDFELLFTMSVKEAKAFLKSGLSKFDIPITLIGEITAERNKTKPKGYLHF